MNETKLESIRNTNQLYIAVKTGKPVDMSAHWNKSGNTKLGNMWTFSTLYGNEEHYVSRLDVKVSGTCGIYCTGCKHACYVRKSYRYGSVIFGHARNTLAIRNDIDPWNGASEEEIMESVVNDITEDPSAVFDDLQGVIDDETLEEYHETAEKLKKRVTSYICR